MRPYFFLWSKQDFNYKCVDIQIGEIPPVLANQYQEN
jgi:hypothetical protein